jgi:hypothetical protein
MESGFPIIGYGRKTGHRMEIVRLFCLLTLRWSPWFAYLRNQVIDAMFPMRTFQDWVASEDRLILVQGSQYVRFRNGKPEAGIS